MLEAAQRRRRLLRTVALALLLVGCSGSAEDGSVVDATTTEPAPAAVLPRIVRGLPEPAGAYATWWPAGPADGLTLEWREEGGDRLLGSAVVSGRTGWSIDGLQDGTTYELQLRHGDTGGPTTAVTPRARPDCSFVDFQPDLEGVSLFCTRAALEAHLEAVGVDPEDLSCRGRPVQRWDRHAPDCAYTLGDRQFVLTRAVDDVPAFQEPLPTELARAALADLVWGEADPWRRPEAFPALQPTGAATFAVDLGDGIRSEVIRLEPPNPVPGRYALFHEGHDATALGPTDPEELLPAGGRDLVDALLEHGFTVYALDMPLEGRNAPTDDAAIGSHTDLVRLDRGDGSPIGRLLLPAKLTLDAIETEADDAGVDDPLVVMMGRSGGGWTTNLVGTLDRRIDASVSIAGGLPQSQHLLDVLGPWQVGDYEQYVPHVYDIVGNENLIASTGRDATFLAYSPNDLCCHRLAADAPFVGWLEEAAPFLGKRIVVSIDPENRRHGLSPSQFADLDAFLASLEGPGDALPRDSRNAGD